MFEKLEELYSDVDNRIKKFAIGYLFFGIIISVLIGLWLW